MSAFRGIVRDLRALLPQKETDKESLFEMCLDPGRPTVVFVSGFGAPSRGLKIVRRRLQRDGFNAVVFSLHWQDVRGDIAQMASDLGAVVMRAKKMAPGSPIHLVAHSAGGIVARYYVQFLGGAQCCESLIALATPHHGTWFAMLGYLSHLALLGRCLWQLAPSSKVIERLNSVAMPEGIQVIFVSSDQDALCPARSTRLPLVFKNCTNVRNIEVTGLSHSDFVLSKKGYDLVCNLLKSSTHDILAAIHP